MRMLAEGLEAYWVVNLAVGLSRVVQVDELVWCQRLFRYGVRVVMLPGINEANCRYDEVVTRTSAREGY